MNILLEKEFDPDKELSMQKLEDYKVKNFDKFIIPINKGIEELKYSIYYLELIGHLLIIKSEIYHPFQTQI